MLCYGDFAEYKGRVTYTHHLYNSSLDRSYDYDQVGRLFLSFTGTEARAHTGKPGGQWGVQDGPYAQAYHKDAWGNITQRDGWGGPNPFATSTYTNNRRDGWGYDLAGNLTSASGHTFTYDATGQQATAVHTSYNLQHTYDGDRLRVKKVEGGTDITYYLRSSVLGEQVVSEIKKFGATWWGLSRGYIYGAGSELLAVQGRALISPTLTMGLMTSRTNRASTDALMCRTGLSSLSGTGVISTRGRV